MPKLLPERYRNRDFFVADIFDAAPKGDRTSMEHPIFSLSKKKDNKERTYEHNGNTIEIFPSSRGLATIWDKDILIFLASQLIEGINRKRTDVSQTVRFTVYEYLVATNKPVGGDHYKRLEEGLDRLAGTRIKTNIQTGKVRIKENFGLIENWKAVEKSFDNERMVALEVTLSLWFFNAVKSFEVLTINRNYFRISGGLDRRLYELARKHCGHQSGWTISLDLLHKKSGSTSTLKEFRRMVKNSLNDDSLPDYRFWFDAENDQVTFYPKDMKKLAFGQEQGTLL